jgi:NADH-quinone oxidoreductase subunit I
MWGEVKDGAYKKLQGNMKRRSGTIGIAPRAQGKVKAPAPVAAKPTAAAAPTAAAKPAAPVAAVGKNMSEEKLARLMAIRASKAGGGAPAPAAAPAAEAVPAENGAAEAAAPVAVATARPVAAGGLPFSADNLLGGVPASTAMAEDKVERLKSIRSGNLERRG